MHLRFKLDALVPLHFSVFKEKLLKAKGEHTQGNVFIANIIRLHEVSRMLPFVSDCSDNTRSKSLRVNAYLLK